MKSPAVAALQAHDEFRPQLTNWRGDRGRDRRRMLGRTTKHPRYDRGQGSKRSGDDDHVQIGGSEPGAVGEELADIDLRADTSPGQPESPQIAHKERAGGEG